MIARRGLLVTLFCTAAMAPMADASVLTAMSRRGPPLGVIAAGLQAVWAHYDDCGVPAGTVLTPIASLGATSGLTYASPNVSVTAACTVTAVDFSGNGVYGTAAGGAVFSATNSLFAAANQGFVLSLGANSSNVPTGAPAFVGSHCTFDMAGVKGGFNGGGSTPVSIANGSSGAFMFCLFKNGQRDLGGVFASGGATFTDCAFFSFGASTTWDDHLEPFHIFGGTVTWTRCLFDPSSGPPKVGGLTCPGPFLEATNADIVALLDSCILTGGDTMGALFTMQLKANVHNITLTIQNCAIRRGLSTYLGALNQAGVCTVINGGGNFDLVTGAAITNLFG